MTDDDPEFTAADNRRRKLLERRLRDRGFVRHPYGFWLAPGTTLKVPAQPDESDEG